MIWTGTSSVDFLTGARVLPLDHNQPELVRVVTEPLGRFAHGFDLPTPARDAFTEAQLSMQPPAMRNRTRPHFCGPTGSHRIDVHVLSSFTTGNWLQDESVFEADEITGVAHREDQPLHRARWVTAMIRKALAQGDAPLAHSCVASRSPLYGTCLDEAEIVAALSALERRSCCRTGSTR